MEIDYYVIFSKFLEVCPFVKSGIILKNKRHILYYSEKWDINSDLKPIMNRWLGLKPAIIKFSGQKYIMRLYSEERLVATSTNADGHIVGIRDKELIILTHIEPDGIIPFVIRELFNVVDAIRTRKPYLSGSNRNSSMKKNEEVEFENKLDENEDNLNLSEIDRGIPLTARLMAYYRALESKQSKPLLIDPYAERLAGDISSFLSNHIRYSEMDYPIVRSHYIEEHLFSKWCFTKKKSQIVILGAGLDSRAYRFKPLRINSHTVFEVDVTPIIEYKQEILANEQPLCKLIRISADLSKPNWVNKLTEEEFSTEIPIFWLLEGIVYYINRRKAEELLKQIGTHSNINSLIFVDIMHKSRWFSTLSSSNSKTNDPIARYLKWGLNIKEIKPFFSNLGWEVTYNFADEYDMGRNVGQKAMVFVTGKLL